MHGRDTKKPQCPVGERRCEHIDALNALRRELEELAELVLTDPLTRLFNYRHFSQALEQERERTHRNGQPTALIMLDLDRFKEVNDVWGHEVGNQVLRHVAEQMLTLLRKIDIPCRYGGEEFALILPGTPLPRAINAAERLRAAIEASPVMVEGKPLFVTASMGVSVFQRNSHFSAEAFVKQVDCLLYEAKARGRNRVAHPDLESMKPKGQVGIEEKAALYGVD
ncbi:GGDEF domain-containing protein [Sedimenticola hydrogenitrophicus]|uniref:GGDEF domain-containing protein n=1 Tax=Sedimenticola hydrogenitrophicus TaxID=2967975 RepID=UPI0021A8892F|nr:GGDEF domain-containing protein [Sedimenticola hydrogenitrophicus]